MKDDYKFPDSMDNTLIAEKLLLTDDLGKTMTISDPELILEMMKAVEYPQILSTQCRFVEPENYDIKVFYQGFFASYHLGEICLDSTDRFGFRDFRTGGRTATLLPSLINSRLHEILP